MPHVPFCDICFGETRPSATISFVFCRRSLIRSPGFRFARLTIFKIFFLIFLMIIIFQYLRISFFKLEIILFFKSFFKLQTISLKFQNAPKTEMTKNFRNSEHNVEILNIIYVHIQFCALIHKFCNFLQNL